MNYNFDDDNVSRNCLKLPPGRRDDTMTEKTGDWMIASSSMHSYPRLVISCDEK